MANDSYHGAEDYSPMQLALRTSFASVTAILSVVCNFVCLVVLPHVTSIPENNRYFLMSLTIADFGTGIATLTYIAPAANAEWVYSDDLCVWVCFFLHLSPLFSIISLIYLTVDKYVAIMKPLRYPQLITKRRVIGLIICTLFICAIYDASLNSPLIPGHPAIYLVSAAICVPGLIANSDVLLYHTFFSGVCVVFLPLGTITLIYIHLYRIIRRQIREIQERYGPSQEHYNKKSALHTEGRIIRMFAAITITYAIAWIPYLVYTTYKNFTLNTIPWLDFIGNWFPYSGSWCDAVILIGMSPAFRKTAKRLLNKCMFVKGIRTAPNSDVFTISARNNNNGES
ncbi:G-protein coupled receptor 52-like [Amphiura filiformis]|uniref:G-protein coupled receptor 52-like n=1 Tax=Amphiura filiformis TaxID=82378 RepID=UPI003B21C666